MPCVAVSKALVKSTEMDSNEYLLANYYKFLQKKFFEHQMFLGHNKNLTVSGLVCFYIQENVREIFPLSKKNLRKNI